ncbi:Shedu anti-phage system protein SduA domain-containing protein [Cupriavidus plantarum]|uniref:Shedu anti-phage system protein SduA domain-containing protein n=1 Tax=Cupriavidus plantarum TaxID=942865 RepID=UPI001B1A92F2|nr:Shedu anti-phage system protein SduA domain-containing protein [Cupriavidus plantarum]CAG2128013.1 hypothetical protein LMG26296_01059 [Cupriavidus plantarum]SMR66809.1 protein of unknown function [Cupriavidus plantarum]
MKFRDAMAVRREHDPLAEFFVRWDSVGQADLTALRSAIDGATREEDVQQFLQAHPNLLIQHLGGGHGRWVIPKQKLGAEHVTDFVIGDRDSMGFHWQAVELESPLRPMFNKSGDPSQYLNHAIRQIMDWRAWLVQNQNYAARSRADNGLGLTDISAAASGLIVIGRRTEDLRRNSNLRRQLVHNNNIKIHTYDYLIETLLRRIDAVE